MIILDTNIISELMKSSPASKVLRWLDKQVTTSLWITTMTIAEITYGLHTLPSGTRRHKLEQAFNITMKTAFKHRILGFDEMAATMYGEIMAHRKTLGKPLSIIDGQIAAVARAHSATVVTRNIRDFVNCGIEVVNPFE